MSEYEGFGANTTGGFGGELKSVTTLDDSGPGSLRSIVDSIQSPTIINFNVSGTIRLNDFLYIPANVTIDGNYKVIINNKGFILPYYNNIFERLLFLNVTGKGDSIRIGDFNQPPVHDVVVNRCHFKNPSYGQLEPEPDEYISVIFGSNNVTISWCSFMLGGKVFLFGNGDVPQEVDENITVTVHHNFMYRTGRRHPYLRYGKVDMYCNILENWEYRPSEAGSSKSYGVRSTSDGEILLENNIINQNYFFKKGWLINLFSGGGYHLGAYVENGGKIQSIGNSKNHPWIKIENTGKVFDRPYEATIDSTDNLRDILWDNLPENVKKQYLKYSSQI